MYAVQSARAPSTIRAPNGTVPAPPMSRVPVASLLHQHQHQQPPPPPPPVEEHVRVDKFSVHGRLYYRSDGGVYPFPIDDTELERLDFLHTMIYQHALDGKLHNVTLPDEPKRILDVGFGSGFWMSEIAKTYRDAQVVGLDMMPPPSPGVPTSDNTVFLSPADFTRSPWPVHDSSIDLVHMAQLCGSVANWESLYATAFRALRPGTGVVEHIEIDWTPRSTRTPFPEAAQPLVYWWSLTRQASEEARRPLAYRDDTYSLLERAGFISISHSVIRIPLYREGISDRQEWRLALDYQMTMGHVGSKNFTGFSMALLTQFLHWSEPAAQAVCDRALETTALRGLPLYMNLHVWNARKPMS